MSAIRETIFVNVATEDRPALADVAERLFPNAGPPALTEHDALIKAARHSMADNSLEPSESTISLIVRLHQTMTYRRSVMLTGRSGTGKSTAWQTLKRTLPAMDGSRTIAVSIGRGSAWWFENDVCVYRVVYDDFLANFLVKNREQLRILVTT